MIHSKLEDVKPEALDEFWAEVAKIGWGTKTTDIRKVKLALLRTWTPEKAARVREVFYALSRHLYRVLDKVVDGVGDDGFDDLRAHIIGLGRKEFERVLKKPTLAQERINRRDYVESFSYCLPYGAEDWEPLKPEYFVKWAKNICAELKEGFKDDRFEPVFPEMQKLIDLFLPAVEGNPLAVLPKKTEALGLRAAIEKRGKWLWRDAAFLDGGHFAVSASVPNFFGDLKAYLGEG